MKILVVNDDSISAPGIALLAQAAASLGEVWVVAPASQCSAMSHKMTIHGPLTMERVDFPAAVKEAWKVSGTPADCVKVALACILKDKPDFVFSGINDGYNAGYDIAYSGTLGAAFEAAMHDIPAIAFSNAGHRPLDLAKMYLKDIAADLVSRPQMPKTVWNVNFPAAEPGQEKGILYDRTIAPVGMYSERYVPTVNPDGTVTLECIGVPLSRDAAVPEGTDVAAIRAGYISVGTVKNTVF